MKYYSVTTNGRFHEMGWIEWSFLVGLDMMVGLGYPNAKNFIMTNAI